MADEGQEHLKNFQGEGQRAEGMDRLRLRMASDEAFRKVSGRTGPWANSAGQATDVAAARFRRNYEE